MRLATSGTLSRLWNSKGLERGNGVAISLLPILALHVTPQDGRTWTRWRRIVYEDFADLAGISQNSVGSTLARLRKAGLLQRKTLWRTGGKLTYIGSKKAKHMVFYRLKAKEVYPQQDEPSAALPASFFELGTWARLTSAEQALYLAQWCLKARPEGFTFAELEDLSGLPRPSLDRALKLLEEKTGKTVVQRPPRGRPRKSMK